MKDITTLTGRKRLQPRREPYWHQVGEAYIGFRALDDGGTWIGRIREDGKQSYQSFGRLETYTDATKSLGEWLEQRKADKKAGVTVRDLTVADACEAYLADILERSGAEKHDRTRGILERSVLGREASQRKPAIDPHPIAKTKLADLTFAQFKDWRKGLLSTSEATAPREEQATAARVFAMFRAALNFAKKERLVASSDAWSDIEGFGNVNAGPDAKAYLTPSQRRSLINACEDDDVRDLLEAMAITGARPVELLRVVSKDFDPRTGKLTLWTLKGKNGERRERTIPTNALRGAATLFSRLAKDKLPAAPLFRASRYYHDWVQKAVETAGLPTARAPIPAPQFHL